MKINRNYEMEGFAVCQLNELSGDHALYCMVHQACKCPQRDASNHPSLKSLQSKFKCGVRLHLY